jgi:hypothetical protein
MLLTVELWSQRSNVFFQDLSLYIRAYKVENPPCRVKTVRGGFTQTLFWL